MVETITPAADSREVIYVGDGETFSNVRFDLSEDGSGATVIAKGTNWTIENIAFDGQYGYEDRTFGIADTGGGHSVLRNVYAGDGVEPDKITTGGGSGTGYNPGFGLWVDPKHSGTLDIEQVNITGAIDNGFYASAPGSNSNGEGGVVNFRRCYAENNMISGFRTAGGEVIDCVVVVDDSDVVNGRPLWVWGTTNDGPVRVENCDFVVAPHAAPRIGQSGKTTDITVKDTQTDAEYVFRHDADVNFHDAGGNGNDPRIRMPDGCPGSVDAVFDGVDDSEPEPAPAHELYLEGRFNYSVTVSDRIEPHPDIADYVNEGDAYSDNWAEWYLTGSSTRWLFDGTIEALDISAYDGVQTVDAIQIDGESLTVDEALAWPDHNVSDDPTIAELEARIEELEAELAAVETQRDEYKARLDEYQSEIDLIDDELDSVSEETGGLAQRLRDLLT